MYLGIDFSGGAAPWRRRCARPTVWIASIENAASPRLTDLRPVQDLPGAGDPFAKLTARLRLGDFIAAGIDAPFSMPTEHLPAGGYPALLARVMNLPDAPDRPFPSGSSLLAMAQDVAPLPRHRPFRATEQVWLDRGINTRSTLWNGPRGGAPFTAACLALLARAERPVWPWTCGQGMLVEAFPAAQLLTWRLPHRGYGRPDQRDARERILAGLAERVTLTAAQRASMLDVPDALDAVIAAFAAVAADRTGALASHPADGLIAVSNDGESPPTEAHSQNLLRAECQAAQHEVFEDVLRRPGVRIERIVSRGHTTPRAEPYLQDWDEWVMILEGAARIELVGSGEHALAAGEHLLIPAGVPHLVVHTENPTIWLAVHIGEPARA